MLENNQIQLELNQLKLEDNQSKLEDEQINLKAEFVEDKNSKAGKIDFLQDICNTLISQLNRVEKELYNLKNIESNKDMKNDQGKTPVYI